MSQAENLRATAGRIETVVQEFSALPDPRARQKVEEIVRLLMQLYGAGLGKILEIAVETADKAPGGREKTLCTVGGRPAGYEFAGSARAAS